MNIQKSNNYIKQAKILTTNLSHSYVFWNCCNKTQTQKTKFDKSLCAIKFF